MLQLSGIHKYFAVNGVHALNGADIQLCPGEIHAIVGENGAGKSTLMHIAAGFVYASSGRILLDEREKKFGMPDDALRNGIALVSQHPRVVPGFKLWEYCVLGAEPGRFGLVDTRIARKKVYEASCVWGFNMDIDQYTDTLSIAQRQLASVLAMLLRDVQYLILDEPSAVLSPDEAERLFALLKALRNKGKAVVLISHKLDELISTVDRITVLRKGKTVAQLDPVDCDSRELNALIFGSDLKSNNPEIITDTKNNRADSAVLLSVDKLSVKAPGRPYIRSATVTLNAGMVLGIAGVRDSGTETLELAISGFIKPESGCIISNGLDVTGKGPWAFRKAGNAYVNADRAGTAMALKLPLFDSLIVHAHRRFTNTRFRFLLNIKALKRWAEHIMEEAGVRGSIQSPTDSFSGGMLQRLLLAREFSEKPVVLILSEPGWGLDTAGKNELKKRIQIFTQRGGSVLLFSSDIDELLELSDYVQVLRDGKTQDPLDIRKEKHIRQVIGELMMGALSCDDID